MEENKYYIPKIEEFHVGFEYEVFQKGDTENNGFLTFMPVETEDKWFKFKFPDSYVGYRLDLLFKQQLRVKYLDKSDIESCGFTKECVIHGDSEDFVDGFEKNLDETDSIVIHSLEENNYLIYKTHVYNRDSGNWDQINLFRGTINNLLEFKQVLKMIGVV
jgi:hypothetical protein